MSKKRFFSLVLLGPMLLLAANTNAYDKWSSDQNASGNCATCHGAFNEGGDYFSHAENLTWSGDLHANHLDSMDITDNPNGSCDNCHGGANTNQRQVNLQSSGNAKDGVNAIACMGCHGRLEDANDVTFFGTGWGGGLRQHHETSTNPLAGSGTCGTCHADANPASFTPAPEDTFPPWYAFVKNTAIDLTLDPCSADGQEDFSSNGFGLDNDGDQSYDTVDADCVPVEPVILGDMDGDSKSDILWRSVADGRMSVWFMDGGQRTSQASAPTVADASWTIVSHGDFDGDQKADILWRRMDPGQPGNGQMAVWLMSGGARTANLALPTVTDDSWIVASTGDFDGDGDSDILWRNNTTGQMAMWSMDAGALAENLAVPAATSTDWQVVKSADFDGDGKADLVWRNGATGQMALWRMDGATRIENLAMPTVSDSNWQLMGTGDYDADGRNDLFWRNVSTGLNAIWLMEAASLKSNLPVLSFSNKDWAIAADGDFDGDGKSDLFWRNSANGENSVWLMNGAVRIGHERISPVPVGTWEVVPSD